MRMELEFIDTKQPRRFWEEERAERLDIGANVLRYYRNAQRLVVHYPDFEIRKTGKMRPGKGVALNLEALKASPQIAARLIEILQGATPAESEDAE